MADPATRNPLVSEKDAEAEAMEVEKASSSHEGNAAATFDPKEVAIIRHKIDWRLIPALGAMYGIALMDRNNLPNAAIAGMLVDLDMVTGPGYNINNMAFFITYIALQPLMIIVCRKVGPRWFLPASCLIWGGLIIGFGFAQNWPTLVPLRLLLGTLEAGFFPGCLYLLSCWYSKFEVARRYSLFYFIGSFASALSGILAYGLMQMEGVSGIRGWRWIFIMEGVITCGVAIFAALFLVKFPDEEKIKPSFKFLSTHELTSLIDRLNAERGDADAEPFTWKRFLQPATEWYIYAFPMLLFLVTTVAYGMAFTLPIILRTNLGFSIAMSQCLGAPPYVLSGVVMYIAAWYSDRKQTRGPVMIVLCCITLVGVPIMAFVRSPWVQYFGVCVTVIGVNSTIPSIMAYQATNIRGQWRRAFCSAALTGIGGIGGVAGALIFRSDDAPDYVPGFATCIGCNVLIICIVVGMSFWFKKKNAQADRGECILLEDPSFRFTI